MASNWRARAKVLSEVRTEMNRTDENAEDTPTFDDYLADVIRRLEFIQSSE